MLVNESSWWRTLKSFKHSHRKLVNDCTCSPAMLQCDIWETTLTAKWTQIRFHKTHLPSRCKDDHRNKGPDALATQSNFAGFLLFLHSRLRPSPASWLDPTCVNLFFRHKFCVNWKALSVNLSTMSAKTDTLIPWTALTCNQQVFNEKRKKKLKRVYVNNNYGPSLEKLCHGCVGVETEWRHVTFTTQGFIRFEYVKKLFEMSGSQQSAF